MRYLQYLLTIACMFLCAGPAGGMVKVGDRPDLEISTLDHGTVRLSDFRGKIVLVEFWATWCGPCMQQAPHMVEINRNYASRGLQIIGISRDKTVEVVQQRLPSIGFSWPQHVDLEGALQWGGGLPAAFIIGPEGNVLWLGHPARLDEPLEKAFIDHPPVPLVDPNALANASSILSGAQTALDANKPIEAMRLMGRFPVDANKDEALGKKAKELQDKLKLIADRMLTEIDALVSSGKYDPALSKLRALAMDLNGLPVGKAARQQLTTLMADPRVRQQLEQSKKADKAESALAAAEKHEQDGREELAYTSYQAILKQFPDSEAAAIASASIEAYESNPFFMKKQAAKQEQAAGTKPKAALSLAQSYHLSGRADLARRKYQEVIDQFPGTKEAQTANEELSKLRP